MGNLRIPSGGLTVDGVTFPAGVIKADDPYWAKALEAKGAKPTSAEPEEDDTEALVAPIPEVLTEAKLKRLNLDQLRTLALENGVHVDGTPPKSDLVEAILAAGAADSNAARASEENAQQERTEVFTANAAAGGTGAMTTADLPGGANNKPADDK